MRAAGVSPHELRAVFLTHFHGDHFGGLPFLLLDAQFCGRELPLTIMGAPGLERRLHQAMEALFPNSSRIVWRFPLELREITPGQAQEVAGFSVTPYEVLHASGATPYALRVAAGGKALTYSGDTAWTPALIEASRDVDLFICECYRYDDVVPYHLDWQTLRAHLPELRARRVMLTHLGAAMLAHVDELGLETAVDGTVIAL
ncbi:MAG TPA: MBL fold metallo-hydrolase, partial [bacterium]